MSMLSLLSSLSGMFGGNQNAPGVPFANRNLFVDGNKDVWNGTSASLATSGAYTVAALTLATCGVGGVGTYAQSTFVPGVIGTYGLSRPAKFYGILSQTTASTGTLAAFTGPLLLQRIEDVSSADGASVTLSVWLWVASGTLNVTQAFFSQNFGVGGSPSASVNTAIPVNWNLTTTPQRFSVLMNVPSITGKTVGTTTPGYVQVGVCLPVGATYVVADAQWQLEYCSPQASTSITGNGGAPTTFEYRGQEVEVGRVQRYWENGNFVLSPSSTAVLPQRGFGTPKRIAPTMTLTPSSGTGGVIAAIGIDAFWQNTAHSAQVAATWTADARL